MVLRILPHGECLLHTVDRFLRGLNNTARTHGGLSEPVLRPIMIAHDLADEARGHSLHDRLNHWQTTFILHRSGSLKHHAVCPRRFNVLDRPVLAANWRLVEGVHHWLLQLHQLTMGVAVAAGERWELRRHNRVRVKPCPSTRLEHHFHCYLGLLALNQSVGSDVAIPGRHRLPARLSITTCDKLIAVIEELVTQVLDVLRR